MNSSPAYRRKLIEVDLPLEQINEHSKRERAIRHGHPSTFHQWWARLSLAACRAVLFASMVDDPSELEDEFPTKQEQDAERLRLHEIIKRLVVWKNSGSEMLLAEARWEIARSVARGRNEDAPPQEDSAAVLRYLHEFASPVYDPFAGSGTIPLEAQRLGLRAIASDLNPIAVLINKALLEIPPKFHHRAPTNPDADPLSKVRPVAWHGAAGLADDIRWYGHWMRERAWERIGHLYPPRATRGWWRGHGHRLAMGAHRPLSEPRVWCRYATHEDIPALHQVWQSTLDSTAKRGGRDGDVVRSTGPH